MKKMKSVNELVYAHYLSQVNLQAQQNPIFIPSLDSTSLSLETVQ